LAAAVRTVLQVAGAALCIWTLLMALIFILTAAPPVRLMDPATPLDPQTGPECRTYPSGLLGYDPQLAARQVLPRIGCWTPPVVETTEGGGSGG
jgi:hypothetical protein